MTAIPSLFDETVKPLDDELLSQFPLPRDVSNQPTAFATHTVPKSNKASLPTLIPKPTNISTRDQQSNVPPPSHHKACEQKAMSSAIALSLDMGMCHKQHQPKVLTEVEFSEMPKASSNLATMNFDLMEVSNNVLPVPDNEPPTVKGVSSHDMPPVTIKGGDSKRIRQSGEDNFRRSNILRQQLIKRVVFRKPSSGSTKLRYFVKGSRKMKNSYYAISCPTLRTSDANMRFSDARKVILEQNNENRENSLLETNVKNSVFTLGAQISRYNDFGTYVVKSLISMAPSSTNSVLLKIRKILNNYREEKVVEK